MAWKELKNQKSTPWMFDSEGELEGIYLESKNAKNKQGKPITFHAFKIEKSGETVSVLGGTVLDRVFSQVEKGTKVKIEYIGEAEGKNGNYKNYKVSTWEE